MRDKMHELTLGFVARTLCEPEEGRGQITTSIIVCLLDVIESAWGLISNASGGNWEREPEGWQRAARLWRDEMWHVILSGRLPITVSQHSPDVCGHFQQLAKRVVEE